MERHADEMIASLASRNECNAMDFARLYPFQVFMDLYGLPLEDRDPVIGWKDAAVAGKPEGYELLAYFIDAIQQRRQSPGSDSVSHYSNWRADGSCAESFAINQSKSRFSSKRSSDLSRRPHWRRGLPPTSSKWAE